MSQIQKSTLALLLLYLSPSCFLMVATRPFPRSLLCIGRMELRPFSSMCRCEPLPGVKTASCFLEPPLELAALRTQSINNFVYIASESSAAHTKSPSRADAGGADLDGCSCRRFTAPCCCACRDRCGATPGSAGGEWSGDPAWSGGRCPVHACRALRG